jgi:U2 small nuclear ribonucleoprotein A'
LSLTSDAANNAALSAAASRGAGEVAGGKGRLLTPEEKAKVREAIKNASSVEEIRRLENVLSEGRLPEGGV